MSSGVSFPVAVDRDDSGWDLRMPFQAKAGAGTGRLHQVRHPDGRPGIEEAGAQNAEQFPGIHKKKQNNALFAHQNLVHTRFFFATWNMTAFACFIGISASPALFFSLPETSQKLTYKYLYIFISKNLLFLRRPKRIIF
jgi:hypothetical protein